VNAAVNDVATGTPVAGQEVTKPANGCIRVARWRVYWSNGTGAVHRSRSSANVL